jgi:hypothetical protein
MDRIKYPYVTMKLAGQNSNPLAILGRAERVMRRAGVPQDEIDDYRLNAPAGDYRHILKLTLETVRCR